MATVICFAPVKRNTHRLADASPANGNKKKPANTHRKQTNSRRWARRLSADR